MKTELHRHAATVGETEHQYLVELEVAGFTRDELALELDGHLVSVSGESRLLDVLEESFRLPEDADPDHVTAYYDRGMLEIHAPRRRTRGRRRVPIVDKPRGLRWAEAELAPAPDRMPVGLGLD
jgi:HSP20 family molecular chaperone IbpA